MIGKIKTLNSYNKRMNMIYKYKMKIYPKITISKLKTDCTKKC